MSAPEPDPRRTVDWSDKTTWHRIGYILSAIWVGGILIVTNGNVRAPLFNFIFIVPLAGWAIGMIVGHLIARRKKTPPRV